eukprot:15017382-Alexandrium_andersonii.AAC.1
MPTVSAWLIWLTCAQPDGRSRTAAVTPSSIADRRFERAGGRRRHERGWPSGGAAGLSGQLVDLWPPVLPH